MVLNLTIDWKIDWKKGRTIFFFFNLGRNIFWKETYLVQRTFGVLYKRNREIRPHLPRSFCQRKRVQQQIEKG